jgi:hypothetical protein
MKHYLILPCLLVLPFVGGCAIDASSGNDDSLRAERDELLRTVEREQEVRGEQQQRIAVLEADLDRLQAQLASAQEEVAGARMTAPSNDRTAAQLREAQSALAAAERRAEAAERRLEEMRRPVPRLGGNPEMNKDGPAMGDAPAFNKDGTDMNGPTTMPTTQPAATFNK